MSGRASPPSPSPEREPEPAGPPPDLAARVAAPHVGEATHVEPLEGGQSNHAFRLEGADGAFVVRLSDDPRKRDAFARERRATVLARDAGVPAQVVVADGETDGWAYLIARQLPGEPAVDHPERLRILEEVGRLARVVHRVRTSGHGYAFTGIDARAEDGGPPGAATWSAFLHEELDARGRLARLRERELLSDRQHASLDATLDEVAAWSAPPVLNHGDLRLKNVLVDDGARVVGLIDWEWAVSAIGGDWDLSIALHDLSVDAKQALLAGYGLSADEVRRAAPAWRLFNVLNYAPTVDEIVATGDAAELDRVRMRLSGALDLYGGDDEG